MKNLTIAILLLQSVHSICNDYQHLKPTQTSHQNHIQQKNKSTFFNDLRTASPLLICGLISYIFVDRLTFSTADLKFTEFIYWLGTFTPLVAGALIVKYS